jgi:hypothetical protein
MTPDEMIEIRQRTAGQKCFVKNCENCFHYRDWPATDQAGRQIGIKKACSIEVLAVTLRRVIGSIDGTQAAANETRNTVFAFGQASQDALDKISEGLTQINKTELIEDADS